MEFACDCLTMSKVRQVGAGKVLRFGNIAAEGYYVARDMFSTVPEAGHCVTLALVPANGQMESPRFLRSGDRLVVELQVPSGWHGLDFVCRICAGTHEIAEWLRSLERADNHRRSGRVIAGMFLLLATCGWILGGEDGAKWAVSGAPMPDDSPITPEIMLQQFGARLLHPAEMPMLFDMLHAICARAGLPSCPDLYYLPTVSTMNAYALGGPRRSAITLTDGLLGGMTPNEIFSILAHEVAHIRNGDARAMSWATMLQRAIVLTSLASLAALQRGARLPPAPLAALLNCASAIGQLLCLALSRIREFDADATALDLIDDPQALVSALDKLERHHNPVQRSPAAAVQNGGEFLRSHPTTSERVGHLLRLALAF
jgi:heat shock protein HtpX